MELIQDFQARKLPVHPLVMSAIEAVDRYQVAEFDVLQWWGKYGDRIAISYPDAIDLNTVVSRYCPEPVKDFERIKPWLSDVAAIENGAIKIFSLKEVYHGVLLKGDKTSAKLIAECLIDSTDKFVNSGSVEYAELLAIATLLERKFDIQKTESVSSRFESCKAIIDRTVAANGRKVASAFLKAID